VDDWQTIDRDGSTWSLEGTPLSNGDLVELQTVHGPLRGEWHAPEGRRPVLHVRFGSAQGRQAQANLALPWTGLQARLVSAVDVDQAAG